MRKLVTIEAYIDVDEVELDKMSHVEVIELVGNPDMDYAVTLVSLTIGEEE